MPKKKPGFLKKEVFLHHKEMKEKNPSYPRLPKVLVDDEKRMKSEPGLRKSALRGFLGRVDNWKKDHQPYLAK